MFFFALQKETFFDGFSTLCFFVCGTNKRFIKEYTNKQYKQKKGLQEEKQ